MRANWNYSNYGNDLKITSKDANLCSHAGDCESDVLIIMRKPYLKKQLDNLCPIQLAKELKEYGAWDSKELLSHKENLIRWVWISCNDISERK